MGTTASLHPRLQETRAASSRSRWVPALLALGVVVVASGVAEQLLRPFVRRDDWAFLLPPGAPGAADPLLKVEQEGRWLGWVWWYLVGQHGTPTTASAVLLTAWAALAVGFWRVFDIPDPVAGALLLVAFVASPLWIRLAYWPGSLSGATVLAAGAVWVLPWASRKRWGAAGWAAGVGFLSVLSYPPLGGLLLLAAAVHLRQRPWGDHLRLGGAFLLGFAVGVAVTTMANLLAFGHPGPDIASWRRPNVVQDSGDLLINARRLAAQLLTLARALGPAAVVGVVAVVCAVVDRRVRPIALRVAVAFAVVSGLEAAQTLATGVRTNVRGSLWAWAAAVVPTGLLLGGSTRSRRVGLVLLLLLAVLGVQAWRTDLTTHQQTRRAYDAIVETAVRTSGGASGRPVVFRQEPAERRTARGRITEGTLRMMFLEQEGVVVRWCRGEECGRLAELTGRGSVHDLGAVTGVIVPPPPRVL